MFENWNRFVESITGKLQGFGDQLSDSLNSAVDSANSSINGSFEHLGNACNKYLESEDAEPAVIPLIEDKQAGAETVSHKVSLKKKPETGKVSLKKE